MVVVDEQGRLLADSAGNGRRGESYASRPEIAAALTGRAEQGTRQSDTVGDELLYTAVPILDEGRTVGAVRVTQSNAAVGERVRRNVLVVVGVGLAALALGLVLAWVLAGSLARPLRALAGTARRVEDGELDARAEVTGAREQQEVAIAFNEMTERLEQVLEAQREFVGNASHQLRTPLTGLRLRLEAAGHEVRRPRRAEGARARRGGGGAADAAPERAAHARARRRAADAARARVAPRRVRGRLRALASARRGERARARRSTATATRSSGPGRRTLRSRSTT